MPETLDTRSQTANTWECCEECTAVKKITDTDSVLGGASQSHHLLNRTCEDLFKAATKKRKEKKKDAGDCGVCNFVATETSKNRGGQGCCFPLFL